MGYTPIRLLIFFLYIQKILLPVWFTVLPATADSHPSTPISNSSLEGCPNRCGDLIIPYPFGMREGCYLYSGTPNGVYYKITCSQITTSTSTNSNNSNSSNPPRIPVYGASNLTVLNITVDGRLTLFIPGAYECYNRSGHTTIRQDRALEMVEFPISTTDNKFIALGCDTTATMRGIRYGQRYLTGCMTFCYSPDTVVNGTCSGIGCCATAIPDGVINISAEVRSFLGHADHVYSYSPCSLASVIANNAFEFSLTNLSRPESEYEDLRFPVVFDWSVFGSGSCSSGKRNGSYLCGQNSQCLDLNPEQGYRCECLPGYTGNAYLPLGCQDIDECKDPNSNHCKKSEYCLNTDGGYDCKCPHGFHGNGTDASPCLPVETNKFSTSMKIMTGIVSGFIVLIVLGFWSFLHHNKKKLLRLHENYFRQNGGLLLNQKLSGRRDVSVQKMKMYTAQELEKATNNFHDSNIIGQGGFGTVYKGLLGTNQKVAIKKSLKMNSTQVEHFINEILLLSEINNRNVVKLLGCCLGTEVPLLVYEYVSNGTLYNHLHDEEKVPFLTWDIRLRIAAEVAGVLSYLHNTISTPIIHRDMKSMNILLDENYVTKVSDFGASKLVPMDEQQLATMVLGTWGYLDPEYVQTSELTQKSDVYSFGVVLAELLTRRKAVSYDGPEDERSFAMHFLRMCKDGMLSEILDDRILMEGDFEQIKEVASVAKGCLRLKGDERPTMKEVAMDLEGIRRTGLHSPPNSALGPEEYTMNAELPSEEYESLSPR